MTEETKTEAGNEAANTPAEPKPEVAAEAPKEAAPKTEKPVAPKAEEPAVEKAPPYDFANDPVVLRLKQKFGDKVVGVTCLPARADNITVEVARTSIHEVCLFMRHDKELAYELLSDMPGNHFTEGHFEVLYHLYSFQNNHRIRLKVTCKDDTETVDSVVDVWATANWFEREIFDMYGLTFNNHPDLRRILMPTYWKGHPQRKDYPIHYVPERFQQKWWKTDKNGNAVLTYDFLKDKRG